MRLWSGLVLCGGLLVVTLACTAMHVLSNLGEADFAIAPLVRGDLRELFTSRTFAAAWPAPCHPELLLQFGPIAVMAAVGSCLLAFARRRPECPAEWFAAIALFAGALPYAVGALALRHNTDEAGTGRWLLWMLTGPVHAAALSGLFLLRGAWLARGRTASGTRATDPIAVRA